MKSDPADLAPRQPRTIDLVIGDTAISCMLDVGFFSPGTLTRDPHSHLAYELHCLVSGSCRMELCDSGQIRPLDPGSVLLLPPGCYHCILYRGEGREDGSHIVTEHIRKYALRFTLSRNVSQDRPQIFHKLLDVLSQPLSQSLPEGSRMLDAVHAELSRELLCGGQMARLELYRFFISLIRALLHTESGIEKQPDAVRDSDADMVRHEQILFYLDKNYFRPITEEALAKAMHLSVRHVSRIFSRQFGATFRQVLNQLRLHHAEKLLIQTSMTIEQIACKVGYGSPSAFYTHFKAKHGVSPHRYRRQQEKQEDFLLIPDIIS